MSKYFISRDREALTKFLFISHSGRSHKPNDYLLFYSKFIYFIFVCLHEICVGMQRLILNLRKIEKKKKEKRRIENK